jgi:SAM-dependent methyltransferase
MQHRHWREFWESQTHGGHTSDAEDYLAFEGREKASNLGRGGRLLDFGCGSCELTVHYASQFSSVIAVDFSQRLLDAAKARLEKFGVRNVTLLRADHESVWAAIDGKFDVIMAAGVDQYLRDAQVEALVRTGCERLAGGGRIMFFDVIDARRYWLGRLRRVLSEGPGWTLRGLLRLPTIAGRALYNCLVGGIAPAMVVPPDKTIGYKHPRRLFERIGQANGMSVVFVNSVVYDYRYHACLTASSARVARSRC